MFKSQLHEFVQKSSWLAPKYTSTREGLSHAPKFKAVVEVNGETYESPQCCSTLKAAEQAAAKAALDSLGASARFGKRNSGLCKNMLQEYAQKSGFSIPAYKTERSGEDHSPVFVTTVEVGNIFYAGGAGKNKKEAEAKAAHVALIAIRNLAIAPTPNDGDTGKLEQTTRSSEPQQGVEKKRARQGEDVAQQRRKLLCS